MKILVYETEHFEAVYPVLSFFYLPGNRVTLIVSPGARKPLQHLLGDRFPGIEILELDFNIGVKNYYDRLVTTIDEKTPDLIYLNTVNRHHWLIARALKKAKPAKRIILTLHDLNSFFNPGKSFNLRTIVRNRGKAALRNIIREYNILSETMRPATEAFLKNGEKLHNLPGNIYEGNPLSRHYSDKLILAVPGTLDYTRRDYDQVFELALMAERAQCKIEIVLAGGHKNNKEGKEILSRANRYLGKYSSVIAHDLPELPQPLFDEFLKVAHFVWIPSVIQTRTDRGTKETYGLTKTSGSLFDSIRHALPCILPTELKIPGDIEQAALKYSSLEDILRLVLTMDASIYENWQRKAIRAAGNYSIQNIREKNPDLLGKDVYSQNLTG